LPGASSCPRVLSPCFAFAAPSLRCARSAPCGDLLVVPPPPRLRSFPPRGFATAAAPVLCSLKLATMTSARRGSHPGALHPGHVRVIVASAVIEERHLPASGEGCAFFLLFLAEHLLRLSLPALFGSRPLLALATSPLSPALSLLPSCCLVLLFDGPGSAPAGRVGDATSTRCETLSRNGSTGSRQMGMHPLTRGTNHRRSEVVLTSELTPGHPNPRDQVRSIQGPPACEDFLR
jgi:hypothetical protein